MTSPGGSRDDAAGHEPIDLTKSSTPANLRPPLEGESSPGTPAATDGTEPAALSRRRRAVNAAGVARDRTIAQLVALLVPLIRATRIPLFIVVTVTVTPAVLVIIIALLRPGPDDAFWVIVAAAGLVVGGWLALRRHQLLAVAKDPDALADALSSVVSGRDMWGQLVDNVSAGKVGKALTKRSRPLRILGGMWRGVQLTGVLTQITEREELLPLMPGRLRGIWMLVIACGIATLVLSLAVVVAALLFLLGA